MLELLVTVGIILILAAIAIPNLLQAHQAAQQSSETESLHSIAVAENTYLELYPVGYAGNLAALGTPGGGCTDAPSASQSCLIDAAITSGQKDAYVFNVVAYNGNGTVQSPYLGFVAYATPFTGENGQEAFCVDEFGLSVHVDDLGLMRPTNASGCEAYSPMQ